MPSQRNIQAVERIKETLARSPVVISTAYEGLNVAAMDQLRRGLRERGLEYLVVKNSLAGLAGDQLGRPQIREVLNRAAGLVLSAGDPVEAAKALTEYVRVSRLALPVQGAVVEDQVLSPGQVSTLATLPPRPELMAQFMGQLIGVVAALASVLNAPARGLATVLERSTER